MFIVVVAVFLVYQSLSANYVAIGMDLRNTKLLEAILKTVDGFHDSYPTFLLSEVVLTYMAVNRLVWNH